VYHEKMLVNDMGGNNSANPGLLDETETKEQKERTRTKNRKWKTERHNRAKSRGKINKMGWLRRNKISGQTETAESHCIVYDGCNISHALRSSERRAPKIIQEVVSCS
jgi:hypothetical protein